MPAETAEEWSGREFAKLLPQGMDTAEHHLLTVEHDGNAVGTVWLYIPASGDRRRAFVYLVEVAEPFRGQGLGRAAMLAAERYALDRGATSMRLHVFGHNPIARHLYDSLGYEVTSTVMTKPLRTSDT